MRKVFFETVGLVHELYGAAVFQHGGGDRLSPGLFDSLMLTFAKVIEDKESVKRARALKAELRAELGQLCKDEEFADAIKAFSAKRLRLRLDLFQRSLGGRLGGFTRAFARPDELKAQLYEKQGRLCALCRHEIASLEDAELDHITPVATGGTNDPANAQLLHAGCNRKKGASPA